MYGFSEKQLKEIIQIFSSYQEIDEAILFGSRAKGTHKEASDVDIAIKGKNITYSFAAKLKSHLEDDTNLPYFFDIIAYKTITSKELKEHIRIYGKTIISGSKNIPEGWVETTLGEMGKIITGKTPSKNHPKDWGEKIDFITPSDIKDNFKYISSCLRKISKNGEERFKNMILPKNAVIVTCIGSDMGKIVLNRNESLTNQQINSIVVNKRYSFNFIFYLLKNSYKILRINAKGSGSTMPILNKNNFELLSFLVPNIEEQKQIAKILTSFDDKIDLLQAQNKTLEDIGQTIFKEWFGKYQVGDELPEGWGEYELGFVSSLSAGGDKPKNTTVQPNKYNKIPIYSNGIKNEGLYGFTDIPKNFEESVTVSARGTIGYVFIRMDPYVPIVRLITIIPNQKYLSIKYLFLWLKNQNINGTGTTQQQLTVPDFKKSKIIIPKFELMNEFTLIIDSIYKKNKINQIQIQTLIKTRDTLLPKLMSGKIRIKC